MSKRWRNILLCMGSLLLGTALYILFRKNTWVAHLFDGIGFVCRMRCVVQSVSGNWLRYYVPDLLWAFSLSCGIQAICESKQKEIPVCAALAFACGTVWEVLQWTNLVSGTGDFWDILMYLTGSVLSILINIKGEKQT